MQALTNKTTLLKRKHTNSYLKPTPYSILAKYLTTICCGNIRNNHKTYYRAVKILLLEDAVLETRCNKFSKAIRWGLPECKEVVPMRRIFSVLAVLALLTLTAMPAMADQRGDNDNWWGNNNSWSHNNDDNDWGWGRHNNWWAPPCYWVWYWGWGWYCTPWWW